MDKFLISTKWLLLLINVALPCLCLDNGLALTPPMGWISWERFRCVTDCQDFPDQCLDENLIMQMADLLSSEGYSQVGYNYVIVDDCWSAIERVFCDSFDDKVLIPSKERFPHGIPYLVDKVHSLGLLFGLYADIGNYTCAGYPGSAGHFETDAFTFADWGIDFLKMDGCHWPPECLPPEYMKFGQALNETGHPIVYSCSWPSYQQDVNMSPNYELAAETCNMWRGYLDIQDSWQSVVDIIDYYASVQDDVAPRAGPGHWNDPDMLLVGGYGLSPDQAKAQMSVWAIMAAPLLLSADLRTMTEQNKEIAMNKGVIAVDQDKLGIQGRRLYEKRGLEVWTRPILPVWDRYKSLAIVFFNRRFDGTPSQMTASLKALGLYSPHGYRMKDLWTGNVHAEVVPCNSVIKVRINPTGVVMLKARVILPYKEGEEPDEEEDEGSQDMTDCCPYPKPENMTCNKCDYTNYKKGSRSNIVDAIEYEEDDDDIDNGGDGDGIREIE